MLNSVMQKIVHVFRGNTRVIFHTVVSINDVPTYSAFHLGVPFLPPEMADLCNIHYWTERIAHSIERISIQVEIRPPPVDIYRV